jgi:hypothetical protein
MMIFRVSKQQMLSALREITAALGILSPRAIASLHDKNQEFFYI